MRVPRRHLPVLVSVAWVAAVAACDRKREGSASVDGGTLAATTIAAGTVPAARGSASAAAQAGDRDEGPDTPPPSGGPWATCADGFRISGNPLRDVTRLGLLCGPATGMRRPDPPLEQTLAPGQPWAFDVPLAAGECLRLVAAVATPATLSVVTSGSPALVSTLTASSGWLVTRRKGPLCAGEATTAHVVVQSSAGGQVAVGRWFLPP